MSKPKKNPIRIDQIYDKMYERYNSEINNLWQRSVYLSSLLVLCFTGYGSLLLKMFTEIYSNSKLFYINLLLLIISTIGFIMSLVWIAMAKASKAYQEACENNIYKLENNHNFVSKKFEPYIMNGLRPTGHTLDYDLLTLNAGKFSASKLNILIGQIVAGIWSLGFIAHSVFCFLILQKKDSLFEFLRASDTKQSLLVVIIIVSGCCVFTTKKIITNKCKSSSLRKK
ncbi:MAG: hypothetical protein MJ196_06480 [Treponemataceae bacterium]|nr:hypothetical protein [Treponemataceae bacterium]